jgi:hypothetical protein
MDPGSSANIFSVLMVVVAVVGGIITARRGPSPTPAAPDPPSNPPSAPPAPPGVVPGQYYVSPEIWQQLNDQIDRDSRRISHLEERQRQQDQHVQRLQERVDQGETERHQLRRLLHIAVRALFEANRHLHAAHLTEVPVDPQLVPYSVEQ